MANDITPAHTLRVTLNVTREYVIQVEIVKYQGDQCDIFSISVNEAIKRLERSLQTPSSIKAGETVIKATKVEWLP